MVLLYILLGLQIFWGTLLGKVAYKMLVLKENVEDIRSDSEDEGEDEAVEKDKRS